LVLRLWQCSLSVSRNGPFGSAVSLCPTPLEVFGGGWRRSELGFFLLSPGRTTSLVCGNGRRRGAVIDDCVGWFHHFRATFKVDLEPSSRWRKPTTPPGALGDPSASHVLQSTHVGQLASLLAEGCFRLDVHTILDQRSLPVRGPIAFEGPLSLAIGSEASCGYWLSRPRLHWPQLGTMTGADCLPRQTLPLRQVPHTRDQSFVHTNIGCCLHAPAFRIVWFGSAVPLCPTPLEVFGEGWRRSELGFFSLSPSRTTSLVCGPETFLRILAMARFVT